jgi:polysaccharide export outer membrane protein
MRVSVLDLEPYERNVEERRWRRWKEKKMLKFVCEKTNFMAWVFGLLALVAVLCGCQTRPALSDTPPPTGPAPGISIASGAPAPNAGSTTNSPSMVLREGDTVRITFPGAPSLDTVQIIRQDGKITLDMVGEMKAAGLTPKELEQQLLKAYYDQLVVKEVTVTVQASQFIVYVTGAVLRPGKIISDRVLTPLEAVIEAGIDSSKSNMKKVVVIREDNVNGKTESYKLNLDDVLKGKSVVPFILKSNDKIYVPEKFTWW